MTVDDVERRKRNRNRALLYGAIALAFYVAFIMMGVLRA